MPDGFTSLQKFFQSHRFIYYRHYTPPRLARGLFRNFSPPRSLAGLAHLTSLCDDGDDLPDSEFRCLLDHPIHFFALEESLDKNDMNRRFKIAGEMPEDFGDNFSFISSCYHSHDTISLPIKYGKFIPLFAPEDSR